MAQSLELCFHTQSFITKAKLCAATMRPFHCKLRCNHVFHEHRAPERHIATQSFRGGKFWHRALFFAQSIAFVHRAFFEDRITDVAQSIVFCTEHCFCAQSFVFFEEGITDVTQSFVFGTELRFCHFLTGKPVYFLFTLQKLQNSVCNELFYRFSGLGLKKNGCKCPKSPL